jgi:hypothetical protein
LSLVGDSIICAPMAIVYIGSYYVMDMIHATDIWVFMLLSFWVFFMKCGNRSDIGMGDAMHLEVGML